MKIDFTKDWEQSFKEIQKGMEVWRQDHPKATLREIEMEIDRRLDRLRSHLIGDTAMASDRTDWKEGSLETPPRCPNCQETLDRRGQQERRLQSQGVEEIILERTYGVCPACGAGLFPPG
jgi:hypothetical protein